MLQLKVLIYCVMARATNFLTSNLNLIL